MALCWRWLLALRRTRDEPKDYSVHSCGGRFRRSVPWISKYAEPQTELLLIQVKNESLVHLRTALALMLLAPLTITVIELGPGLDIESVERKGLLIRLLICPPRTKRGLVKSRLLCGPAGAGWRSLG